MFVKPTDKSKVWNKGIDRMDTISQKYYDNADGGWLIMQANPQYVDEFEIPDGALIRIPFPYAASLQQFVDEMTRYDNKFGF